MRIPYSNVRDRKIATQATCVCCIHPYIRRVGDFIQGAEKWDRSKRPSGRVSRSHHRPAYRQAPETYHLVPGRAKLGTSLFIRDQSPADILGAERCDGSRSRIVPRNSKYTSPPCPVRAHNERSAPTGLLQAYSQDEGESWTSRPVASEYGRSCLGSSVT